MSNCIATIDGPEAEIIKKLCADSDENRKAIKQVARRFYGEGSSKGFIDGYFICGIALFVSGLILKAWDTSYDKRRMKKYQNFDV